MNKPDWVLGEVDRDGIYPTTDEPPKWAYFIASDAPSEAKHPYLLRGGMRSAAIADRGQAEREFQRLMTERREYWEHRVAERDNIVSGANYVLRANGHCYTVKPMVNGPMGKLDKAMLGFGGSLFRFRVFSTGEVIESNNVWHGGQIPTRYRDQLSDNAELLS